MKEYQWSPPATHLAAHSGDPVHTIRMQRLCDSWRNSGVCVCGVCVCGFFLWFRCGPIRIEYFWSQEIKKKKK